MPRRLRHVPEKTTLIEITCRTLGEMYLLKPTKELEQIVVGIIGRAQRRHPVLIHSLVFVSNHFHMLITPGSSKRMAKFMKFVNSNIALEAGRLSGWRRKFWSRRYSSIKVSDEPAMQVKRLRYALAHGCKEGLVGSPKEWPGASSVHAQLGDLVMKGLWFDRTKEYNARLRGEKHEPQAFAEEETITLSPLPCWAHLSPELNRELVATLIADIEHEQALIHEKNGTEPAGIAYVLSLHYEDRPRKSKRSPAPAVHAFAKKVRKAMEEAYRLFYNAFRAAADALKEGTLDASFPNGSFPPGRPFVGPVPEMVPG